jgi:DNA-binding GntR family transcriptional regulator
LQQATGAAAGAREPGQRARYLQLAAELRADIADGRLKTGDLMPTESQLTTRFGVSRFTVREALRQLAIDGLVRRKRGSGTIITDDSPILEQSFSDTRSILQYAASSTFLIEPPRLMHLPPAMARLLKRPEGEPWHHIRGLRIMDAAPEPIAVTDAFIHTRFAAHIAALQSGQEALFSQLQRLAGLSVGRVTQEIQAVAATGAEAAALHIPSRSACLRILRHYFDDSGAVAEMSCSVHPGERFSYTMAIEG